MVLVKSGDAVLVRLRHPPPWEASPPPVPLSHADLCFLIALCDERADLRPDDPTTRSVLDRLDAHGLLSVRGSGGAANAEGRAASPIRSARSSAGALPVGELVLPAVICLGVGPSGFEAVDHDATASLYLGPDELWAALSFGSPRTLADALFEQRRRLGDRALSDERFGELVARLLDHGLLEQHEATGAGGRSARAEEFIRARVAHGAFRQRVNENLRAHDAAEAERALAARARPRAKVVLVHTAGTIPPLSLGMILAHARHYKDGALHETYDLHPRWVTDLADAPAPNGTPTVYLFTDYLWSHEANLDFSRRVKATDPDAVTIHGGPDCPSSAGEAETYLRQNPHVDVAVRGEGEVTASEILEALAPSVRAGRADRSALADVAGLTVRIGDRIVRSADRPRIEDIDTIPSPYLAGAFDAFGEPRLIETAIIETNRGCPYGCTFCNWGSATNSRVRKFDLQRVLDELTWCAEHEVQRIFLADANFGMFPRDVDIARHVVELKRRFGYPRRFITNYAKNSVKHLKEIVFLLAQGGVLTEGLISLQSMDGGTLEAVRRSNIRLEKYEELAREFRQAKMPLFVDLMMGLPGQTVASLRHDLQQCVDREVNAKCHATELLVNSPMNEPAYRSEHQLEVSRPPGAGGPVESESKRAPAFVISSASFSRDDYRDMHMMRRAYLLCENLGVLRQVTRFVRAETGLREVAILEEMRSATTQAPDRWPHLALALNAVPDVMAPPITWGRFISDVGRYLTSELGLRSGTALDTVLAVQHALLPAPGRSFPVELDLAHDYAAWHRDMVAAKDAGRLDDWEVVVKRLSAHPPSRMTISDPNDLCRRMLGAGSAIDPYLDWELDSPVARAMPAHHQL